MSETQIQGVHATVDGLQGYRSSFDQILLVQEILEEIPLRLGLRPVMPPFLLPYYNGLAQDDCGVSAFVFLEGGHFTLHTFSIREAFFADIFTVTDFSVAELGRRLGLAFGCEHVDTHRSDRRFDSAASTRSSMEGDFGPHVFVQLQNYRGPADMNRLFHLFDRLPQEIGMTPIMRPYIVNGTLANIGEVSSAITMLEESHIALHVFHERRVAFFDLFSCKFFEVDSVFRRLRELLPSGEWFSTVFARGHGYRALRASRPIELARRRIWLGST